MTSQRRTSKFFDPETTAGTDNTDFRGREQRKPRSRRVKQRLFTSCSASVRSVKVDCSEFALRLAGWFLSAVRALLLGKADLAAFVRAPAARETIGAGVFLLQFGLSARDEYHAQSAFGRFPAHAGYPGFRGSRSKNEQFRQSNWPQGCRILEGWNDGRMGAMAQTVAFLGSGFAPIQHCIVVPVRDTRFGLLSSFQPSIIPLFHGMTVGAFVMHG